MSKDDQKNLHAGHRGRIRSRYIESGDSGFSDHELLELLLFYAIPRGNTNETAHLLIERFGGIEGIAEATIDELVLVDGVGKNSAILLKLVLSLAKRYALSTRDIGNRLDTLDKAAELARQYTMGAVCELVYATYLDPSMRVIDTCLISTGTVNESRPMLRTILELCLVKRASSVLLFHNHPNGSVEPSSDDIRFTTMLQRELELIGSNLAEHLIVNGTDYLALLKYIRDPDAMRYGDEM